MGLAEAPAPAFSEARLTGPRVFNLEQGQG